MVSVINAYTTKLYYKSNHLGLRSFAASFFHLETFFYFQASPTQDSIFRDTHLLPSLFHMGLGTSATNFSYFKTLFCCQASPTWDSALLQLVSSILRRSSGAKPLPHGTRLFSIQLLPFGDVPLFPSLSHMELGSSVAKSSVAKPFPLGTWHICSQILPLRMRLFYNWHSPHRTYPLQNCLSQLQ
ncbi:hypothetical protein Adt_03223 [Abeliophyllum distichum]|uniref:Uncharacterized protein n=1 Tax=Abeliophyllum distichum TaxID=126358 RepID=A0ABD1VYA8_9LAMI